MHNGRMIRPMIGGVRTNTRLHNNHLIITAISSARTVVLFYLQCRHRRQRLQETTGLHRHAHDVALPTISLKDKKKRLSTTTTTTVQNSSTTLAEPSSIDPSSSTYSSLEVSSQIDGPPRPRPIVTVRSSFDWLPSSISSLLLSSTTTSTSFVDSTTKDRSPSSLMSYTRGWAWQTVLLQQRLLQKKQHEEQSRNVSLLDPQNNNNNTDTILFLEHEPVYTLGRGADETHIKDLLGHQHLHYQHSDADQSCQEQQQYQEQIELCRQRLSRKTMNHKTTDHHDKQNHSSRLIMDSNTFRAFQSRFPMARLCDDGEGDDFHELQMVDLLCEHYVPKHPVRLPIVPSLLSSSTLSCSQSEIESSSQQTDITSIPLYRVERGGQITYHGPGQLIIYPIFDLAATSLSNDNTPYWKKDLHWFVHQMEQVMIDTTIELLSEQCLSHNDKCDAKIHCSNSNKNNNWMDHVVVGRDDQHTGVWVTTTTSITTNHTNTTDGPKEHRRKRITKNKIAAIGISASRWITSHGICYNVHPNLDHYDPIVPCGISTNVVGHGDTEPLDVVEYGVTSLHQLLQQQQQSLSSSNNHSHHHQVQLSMAHVSNVVLKHMQRIFQMDLLYGGRID